MEFDNNKLIEKWGFWLVFYTLISTIFQMLLSAALSYSRAPVVLGISSMIQLPCLLGGILYLCYGAKFRSAIFLCAGTLALITIIFFGHIPILSFYINDKKAYGFIFFVSFCLLIARRSEIRLGKDGATEKWGIWLANFAIGAPFVACSLYFLSRIFPGNSAILFPEMKLGLMILIPCAIGGITYLFLGAKQRSFKYASVGLAALLLGYLNFVSIILLTFNMS